ncbi:sugar ABC transporter ATP-binding protein [Oceanivirga salmonicida]|uniref:sugar ABC transporter ATP-binding protein n=1 Tax=Oceanivirga salmonicida TaxID=1769291 RepID=UPI0012E2FA72|nr:sugar ABC transporter ATP-binding protein [Oceanivirga salmonicida]
MKEKIIEFKNITKIFPGVKALDNISFDIKKGEIHALMGENGAGKSTLLNILHGVYPVYDGNILLDNKRVSFNNTHEAIESGIYKVHQEISLVEELTIGQNIVLGKEPLKNGIIDYKKLHEKANEILKKLNCNFKSEDRVKGLSLGEMQMIAIAKALYHNAKIISLDEPTASLSNREVNILSKIIKELKKNGITILYVSHRIEEIFTLCDRITILRDGKYINTFNVKDINKNELIKNMVGRDMSLFANRGNERFIKDEIVLEVKNLTVNNKFKDINFVLKKGEILGFSGLVGSKRTDIVRCLFGADKKDSGEIFINGKKVDIKTPKDAVKNKIGLIPENRKTQGFIKDFSNSSNIVITAVDKLINYFMINYDKKKQNSEQLMNKLRVQPKDIDHKTFNLSGGNQQKIVISKWLFADADIIILDEPTKGIDVGAKSEIYKLMENLVKNGKSIIMISSELPEIIGLSDRVIVFNEGKQIKELMYTELNEEKILYYAMGGN